VLLAALLYGAGLSQYLLANATALSTLAAAPVEALGTGTATVAPLAFVGAALAASGPALLFPAGLVALPLVFGAVVVRFGTGTAYLYLVAAAAPLAALAAGGALPAVLLGLVVLPVAGTLVFLGDVGRYLAATR
jgi:hypothetical protein